VCWVFSWSFFSCCSVRSLALHPQKRPDPAGRREGVVFRGNRPGPLRTERAGEGRRLDDSEKDLKTGGACLRRLQFVERNGTKAARQRSGSVAAAKGRGVERTETAESGRGGAGSLRINASLGRRRSAAVGFAVCRRCVFGMCRVQITFAVGSETVRVRARNRWREWRGLNLLRVFRSTSFDTNIGEL